MAKIGTAHVELKPVLDTESLERFAKLIEDSVEAAVTRALATAFSRPSVAFSVVHGADSTMEVDDLLDALTSHRRKTGGHA